MTPSRPKSLADLLTDLVAAWRASAADVRAWGAEGECRAIERCAYQLEHALEDAAGGNG